MVQLAIVRRSWFRSQTVGSHLTLLICTVLLYCVERQRRRFHKQDQTRPNNFTNTFDWLIYLFSWNNPFLLLDSSKDFLGPLLFKSLRNQRDNIIFILPRTTGHVPVVWVRLVAYTKLRHPHEGTRQGFCLIYKLIEATTK